jgi:hypothetical protein
VLGVGEVGTLTARAPVGREERTRQRVRRKTWQLLLKLKAIPTDGEIELRKPGLPGEFVAGEYKDICG